VRQTFEPAPGSPTADPGGLVKRLEAATELGRAEWPPTLLRSLWEALCDVFDGRRQSPAHEMRWLNLTGYALRPGFGLALDDWRGAQTWRLFAGGGGHPRGGGCRPAGGGRLGRTAGRRAAGPQPAPGGPPAPPA